MLLESRSTAEVYRSELATAKNAADSSRVHSRMDELDQKMEQFYQNLLVDHPDLFVTRFLSATRDPVPPDSMVTGTSRERDSIRYTYYRNHYFDNFDVSDIRLLHTPLYERKIMTYISKVVPQHPDTLKVAVDYLIEESRSDPELFRYMLITLFNHFAESKFMGMDAVYFHIAEKYYIPEATWSDPEFIEKLKENIEANRYTQIGEIAPDIVLRKIPAEYFQIGAVDTTIKRDPHIGENFRLHDVNARFIILYFWEADCGHCKKSTPELQGVYERLKEKDVEVISVHVINSIEGKEIWTDFVNEHKMYDWINCWSPYSNDFRKLYNLQSFPQLFILDESKKIIAKKVTPTQAEEIINTFIEIEGKP
jgi:thiol-disulfide isomerase/thioredoxin